LKKIRECREYRCTEPPYRDGLCEEHYEENKSKQLRHDAAVNALHMGIIDGRVLDNQELRGELLKVRKWWDRACRSVNYNVEDEILRDEAQSALEWCIAIAQEIIDEELAYRSDNSKSFSKEISKEIKRIAWERFENLEAGLMSNGVARQSR
jgi:hypothetical protein